MGKKEGEKNGGGNKVAPAPAPAEKKDDVSVTAVYKINCNCNGCVEKIEKALRHFDGVEEVKIDRDACELTVKGTNLDLTAIREKLEKEIKKKFELVSPQPKKGGGGGGGGGYKKPEKKKAEKKEEPKKPKELRDELHKEILQLARENLENEPPIMELRNQKEGEKNGGDNKVAPAEKKDVVSVTAIYKIDCNCEGCVEKIKKALCHFDGVEELKIDCNKLTVKGTNLDPTAIREKLEKEIKKKFELVSTQPKKGGGGGGGGYKKPEKKKAEKKEEPKKPKEPRPQDGSSQSWYPPSVVSSPNSSRPGTPSSASSSSFSSHRTSDRPQSPSHVSPAEAAGIIAVLKDKSVDELRKLLSDKDAYHHFLLSLDQVKIQNNSRDELRKETLQLARENLEKEPRIMELRNQCRIIRTTELAAAQEKLNELERKKEETLKFYSPQSLLQRLQDANKTEEESENLHKQLLDRDVDLGTFVQKYKKLRTTYHRRALIHLSAKTSSIG
ncbi:heavy metal-associated isoprenylated plant protein 6-like isoform X22 [Quercus robur]|uniref:heavy metal-associated isoprenylated plant protein 6-like isoform X22 n=1 Tax=Quercus robur TaxID=38942 RepID=UPI0021616150|nr:heavy metal-associated isoprenylated plant protein 6-like isoform X22 [Quercus robur]